jgi:hypothetical protein
MGGKNLRAHAALITTAAIAMSMLLLPFVGGALPFADGDDGWGAGPLAPGAAAIPAIAALVITYSGKTAA